MKKLYILYALISIYFNGLSINSSTGVISGKPTAAGFFKTTISGTNAGGTDSKTLVFTIATENSSITATGSSSFTYTGSAQGPATSTVTGSTGAITYSYSGVSPTVYSASSTAPTNVGTYQVIASVAAEGNYNAATSDPLAFSITKADQTITFGALSELTYSPSGTSNLSATS